MTVADRIREKRKELNLTQTEFAKKIGYSDKTSVSKIENSGDDISMKKIRKIADALNIPPEYFMGWDQIDYARQAYGFYDFLGNCGLTVHEDAGMYYEDYYPGRDWIIQNEKTKEEYSLSISEMNAFEKDVKNYIINTLSNRESSLESAGIDELNISEESKQIAIAYSTATEKQKRIVELELGIDFKKESVNVGSSGSRHSDNRREAIA